MSTSKHLNRVCAVILVLCLAVTLLLCFPDFFGIEAASKTIGYESRLFDTSKVHTIDIVMDDWDEFIESCENEEYSACTVVIDGESYKNVALRAKGNTSLSQVAQYNNDRYSFKLEFDHYSDALNYHGLDKLCLNNIIQDNTYMKDYLCYTMMSYAGVNAPLCSFAYMTVNGDDRGLYLAVEAIEDGFLERNYSSTGDLYKPDSMSMGGGRGNGKDFEFDNEDIKNFKGQSENPKAFSAIEDSLGSSEDFSELKEKFEDSEAPDDLKDLAESIDFSKIQGVFTPDNENQRESGHKGGGFGGAMGSDDVKLVYTDDDFDSYSNIFDNAKTDISDSDKERLISSLKILSSEDASSAVDIEKVISYFAVHNFVCNFDSYTGSMIHNYYLYEKDGILSMIPWDYNLAFGTFQGGESNSMINYPIDSPVSGGDTDSRPMIAWIFDDEGYTELYHTALSEFIAEYFESGYFEQEFERVYTMISPYVEKDPTKFCTYDVFTEGSETLKQFCLLRAKSVRGQLDGSIPSTSEGQSTDSTSLIDGSSVKLSLMGSMGGGGFGGSNNGQGGFTPPDNANNGGFGEMPDMSNMDFGNFTPPEMPDGDNNGFTSPQMPQDNSENAEESAANEAASVPPAENKQETAGNPDADVNLGQDKAERNNKPQEISDREHNMPDNFGQQESSNDTIILLGVSAAALLAAIILTKLFKDRL